MSAIPSSSLVRQHQVEVCAFDQLLGLNSELIHELTRFANSLLPGIRRPPA